MQLPIFNEQYVVDRLVDAVCRMEYPKDRLDIQVLDDSTDETVDVARAVVDRYAALGNRISYIHRDNRHGFKAGALEAEGGALGSANYAQRTFSENFSSAGAFAGKTVDEVASALRSGELKPTDVPIQYVVKDGQSLILNTRSAQALERAGIPRSQWYAVNMTGDAAAEARLAGQLQRNNLTNSGTPTVTPEQ